MSYLLKEDKCRYLNSPRKDIEIMKSKTHNNLFSQQLKENEGYDNNKIIINNNKKNKNDNNFNLGLIEDEKKMKRSNLSKIFKFEKVKENENTKNFKKNMTINGNIRSINPSFGRKTTIIQDQNLMINKNRSVSRRELFKGILKKVMMEGKDLLRNGAISNYQDYFSVKQKSFNSFEKAESLNIDNDFIYNNPNPIINAITTTNENLVEEAEEDCNNTSK